MMWKAFAICVLSVLFRGKNCNAQNAAPSTGEITVRTSQIFDSAVLRVGQAVQASVMKSTAREIPSRSIAFMTLLSDQAGMTLRLSRIQANGQLLRASSSSVQLASGLFNKMNNIKRQAGEPAVAVSGGRIYLHANTDIVFTLAPPPAAPAPAGGTRVTRQTPPPPPSHPANTVRDLPPAAAGYPPIHASHDAQEKCWWKPFVSETFGFEAAVETCQNKETTETVVETNNGIGLRYTSDGPTDPPHQMFAVYTKPADQPIEAAIKQQLIMKLKSPAARLNCKVVKGLNNGAPGDTSLAGDDKSIQIYSVAASGAYAKQKKFQVEEPTDVACPGLESNDAEEAFVWYKPSESKTKFLFFVEDDNGATINNESIHFLPQQ